MKKIFLLLFLFVGLTACKEQAPEEPFKTVKELKGETFLSGDQLMDPWNIAVMNNVFIVMNLKSEPLVELYDKESRKLTTRFMSIGHGPSEMRMGGMIQTEDSIFYLYDMKILKCRLNDIKKDSVYMPEVIFSITDLDEKHQYYQSETICLSPEVQIRTDGYYLSILNPNPIGIS